VETGANIFDYDGEISRYNKEFHAAYGRYPSYAELKDIIDPIEKWFNIGGVSARIFEAAVMRTPLILFKGRYSDVVRPHEHYIPLEKDFSNVSEVLNKLENLDELEKMAERTYHDLVASRRYGYRYLADVVTGIVEDLYPTLINQDFIAFRRQTGAAYVPLQRPEMIENESEARIAAFSERPTPDPMGDTPPMGADELNARQHRFSLLKTEIAQRAAQAERAAREQAALAETERVAREAAEQSEALRLAEEARVKAEEASVKERTTDQKNRQRGLAFLAARRAWRCLPRSFRYRIGAFLAPVPPE
jgi:hypothetical protein